MENANEPGVLAGGEQPREQLGFVLPRLGHRRFNVAFFVAVWGVAGLIISTAVVGPGGGGVAANPYHAMLEFVFLIAGLLLLFVSVPAADMPAVERVAARLEGLIMAMIDST